MTCAVCLAADNADPSNLGTLVRYQAVKLDQARAQLLPVQVECGRLRDRVRELEDIIRRQNKIIQGRKRLA